MSYPIAGREILLPIIKKPLGGDNHRVSIGDEQNREAKQRKNQWNSLQSVKWEIAKSSDFFYRRTKDWRNPPELIKT